MADSAEQERDAHAHVLLNALCKVGSDGVQLIESRKELVFLKSNIDADGKIKVAMADLTQNYLIASLIPPAHTVSCL
eukprot:7017504-Pyramimonas_sp.AAC.1